VQKKNRKNNNKTPTSGNKPIGVLPTVGSSKASKQQHIFRQEPGAGSFTDPLPVQIDEGDEYLQSGQEALIRAQRLHKPMPPLKVVKLEI